MKKVKVSEHAQTAIDTLRTLGVLKDLSLRFKYRYGTTVEEAFGPSREKHIAQARQEALYMVRMRFKWSYPTIGRMFDMHHTSVMAAVKKVEKTLNKEEKSMLIRGVT